jgi:hypothetical protein
LRHSRRTTPRRDFVPWRFSDAGRRTAWRGRHCRRPKTCAIGDITPGGEAIGASDGAARIDLISVASAVGHQSSG